MRGRHVPTLRSVALRFSSPILLLCVAIPMECFAIDFFFVTNTNDAGAGSLRQAILDANGSDDGNENRIVFAIASLGPHTIQPETELPLISADQTILDGLTQSDSDCSTWPPSLEIELNGDLLPEGLWDGIDLAGKNSVVRGLVINGFSGAGVFASSINGGANTDGSHRIECNLIGTDVTGSSAVPNRFGILINLARNITIGGPTESQRNLISGNSSAAVMISGDEHDIENNFVGLDALGGSEIPNGTGIMIQGGTDNTIGGLEGDATNYIAGNDQSGVWLRGSSTVGNFVLGNAIGVGPTDAAFGNFVGVDVSEGASDNVIGTSEIGFGNVIAHNQGAGVRVRGDDSLRNSIVGNRMSANGGLGIQHGNGSAGVPNDPDDGDEGANRLQNHPDVYFALPWDADTLEVTYRVPSDAEYASYNLVVDFYIADADGSSEGRFHLGRLVYDGGIQTSHLGLKIDIADIESLGNRIVAAATDASGNTSQFSPAVVVPEPSVVFGLPSGVVAAFALKRRSAKRNLSVK